MLYKPFNSSVGVPYRIELSYDSGLLVTGTSTIMEIDSGGELLKLDANGKKLWTRSFNGKVYNRNISFKQCSDGGYFIYGTTYRTDVLGDGFVGKLNPCGELVWGQIFMIPEWNWVTDVFELDSDKLLIVQSGNSFRTEDYLYSHVGIYENEFKKFTKQLLIPSEPLFKKVRIHNGRFYLFNTWTYPTKNDSNVAVLGSSGISFDSSLSSFGIRFYAPEAVSDTLPLFICPPVFLNSGQLISGGSILGLRNNIGYPMAFGKFDKHLNWTDYKDMGHIRTPNCSEIVEHMIIIGNDKFIALANIDPNHDYVSTMNSQAEAYLIDTNFTELKSIWYGDTSNFKYWTHDAIKDPNGNILILMHRFKHFGNISYELVKIDSNLNLVKTTLPFKKYDYKCSKVIDTIGFINMNQFDTITIVNWSEVAKNNRVNASKSNLGFSLYPNPANFYSNLEFDSPKSGKVELIDYQGKQIYTRQFYEETKLILDLSSSANGLYFIIISLDDLIVMRPILIQKY
ncbi:MAG: T9SS type A sorting domain-containing protein [Bacteroidia bacterium]|nr:T9SS type A sorting domain-containing protein [Bacteroidia bacterium]